MRARASYSRKNYLFFPSPDAVNRVSCIQALFRDLGHRLLGDGGGVGKREVGKAREGGKCGSLGNNNGKRARPAICTGEISRYNVSSSFPTSTRDLFHSKWAKIALWPAIFTRLTETRSVRTVCGFSRLPQRKTRRVNHPVNLANGTNCLRKVLLCESLCISWIIQICIQKV